MLAVPMTLGGSGGGQDHGGEQTEND